MVIAGAKKMKINGMTENTLLSEESFARNTWLVKNHPVISRNTERTIYAIGEKKYANISRRKIGITLFIMTPLPGKE